MGAWREWGTWRGQASPLHLFSGMRVVEDVGGENLVCDLFVVVDRFIGLIVQLENMRLCKIYVLSAGRIRLFIIVCLSRRGRPLQSGLRHWLRRWWRLCIVSYCTWGPIHCR